jgi:hypothetical protein
VIRLFAENELLDRGRRSAVKAFSLVAVDLSQYLNFNSPADLEFNKLVTEHLLVAHNCFKAYNLQLL